MLVVLFSTHLQPIRYMDDLFHRQFWSDKSDRHSKVKKLSRIFKLKTNFQKTLSCIFLRFLRSLFCIAMYLQGNADWVFIMHWQGRIFALLLNWHIIYKLKNISPLSVFSKDVKKDLENIAISEIIAVLVSKFQLNYLGVLYFELLKHAWLLLIFTDIQ